jgi:hypothetical protein
MVSVTIALRNACGYRTGSSCLQLIHVFRRGMKSRLDTGRNNVLSSLPIYIVRMLCTSPGSPGRQATQQDTDSRNHGRYNTAVILFPACDPESVLQRIIDSLVFPSICSLRLRRSGSILVGKMYCWETYCTTDMTQRTWNYFLWISWSCKILQNVMHKDADFNKIYISIH